MTTHPPLPLAEIRAADAEAPPATANASAATMPRIPKTAWHYLDPYLQKQDDLRVLLVGCGGNGARMLLRLATLRRALAALGGKDLKVAVFDGDVVSEPNLVRQPFAVADVGQPKATVLVHRINMTYGTSFTANPVHLSPKSAPSTRSNLPHVVISCVDSRAARASIHAVIEAWTSSNSFGARRPRYWLDLGNDHKTGQYLLGTVGEAKTGSTDSAVESVTDLPTAAEKWPEIIDASRAEDDTPSCSSREALEKQDLFVNDVLTAEAASLLWRLLRDGRIQHHGAFCNLQTGRSAPIPVPAKGV